MFKLQFLAANRFVLLAGAVAIALCINPCASAQTQYDATVSADSPQPTLTPGVPIPLSQLLTVTLPQSWYREGYGEQHVQRVVAYDISSSGALLGTQGPWGNGFDLYHTGAYAGAVPTSDQIEYVPSSGANSLSFAYQTAFCSCSDTGNDFASYSYTGFDFTLPGQQPQKPLSLFVSTSTAGDSKTGQPTAIFASLTIDNSPPNKNAVRLPYSVAPGTSTISQAASHLGYLGFDWQQKVMESTPNDVLFSGSGQKLEAPPPYNDPPYGGYYIKDVPSGNYIPLPSCEQDPSCMTAYPFYYPAANLSSECSVMIPGDGCNVNVENGDTSLNFFDSPDLPFLSTGGFEWFTTSLVGIEPCSDPIRQVCDDHGLAASSPLFSFSWLDNYNDNTGGIQYLQTSSDTFAQPGGVGGITLIPTTDASVPEPATLLILASGLMGLVFARHRIRRPAPRNAPLASN